MEVNGLKFHLNQAKKTATVIQLVTFGKIDKLTIPKYVKKINKRYTVTAIGTNAFKNAKIEYLNFEDGTEVISFEPKSFFSSSITNLEIPASIQKLESSWCEKLKKINEIKLSPQNKHFQLIDETFLVGKSNESNTNFDALLYICGDLKFIKIPQQIQIIRRFSLDGLENLSSLACEENSELKIIEERALSKSIEKLVLPESLEFIHPTNWICSNLTMIEVSPNNKTYKLINKRYLCTKSKKSFFYDTIVFALRNIEKIIIPADIRYISDYAFANCKDANEFSFQSSCASEIQIGSYALSGLKNIETIKIKGEKITFLNNAFSDSAIKKIQFLDAKVIRFDEHSSLNIEDADLIIHKNAKIVGYDRNKFHKKPIYFEDLEKKHHHKKNESDKIVQINEMQLETLEMIDKNSNTTSYKVYDSQNFINIYKKVIITSEIDENKIKSEIDVIKTICHPCLCKAINIKMKKNKINESEMIYTLFNEFLSYNLNDCILNNMLNNILKVKVALEVAFGMSFLHQKGIILKNLNASKIRLNPIFEAKIINYGLPSLVSTDDDDINSLIYKSPELYTISKFNRQTDIYSYGVVLHFLFSGKLPVQTLKEKEKRKEINIDQSLFTGSCFDLIKKCLSINPSDRPSSFQEIIKYMKDQNFLLAENVDACFILNRYRYIKSFQCH